MTSQIAVLPSLRVRCLEQCELRVVKFVFIQQFMFPLERITILELNPNFYYSEINTMAALTEIMAQVKFK